MAELNIVRKRPFKGKIEAVIVGFEIHDNNQTLFGNAYVPKKAMDIVNVFCPGVGINHYHAKHYVKKILPRDMGLAMLTPSGHIPSQGEYDPSKNVRFIDILLDHVPKIFLTDRIILSGHSGGGRDALGVAAIRKDIEGLLLISPAYDIYKAMTREWAYLLCSKAPNITGPVVKKLVNRGWNLEEIKNRSKFRIHDFNNLVKGLKNVPKAGDYADRISCPVLIFHGSEDKRIPFEDSEKLTLELAKNGVDVELVKLIGGSHKPFVENDSLMIMKPKIREWLEMIQGQDRSSHRLLQGIRKRINKYSMAWIAKRLKDNYF